jgi:hypothetical protein
MRSHSMARLAAAAAMLAGAGAGVFANAAPASAIQQCQSYTLQADYGVSGTTSMHVYVDDIDFCNPGPGGNIIFSVSISKYVGGVGWEVVATGSGSATYACTGGKFLYTTSVTTAESKPAFYCG